MKKGDFVSRIAFGGKYEIVADKESPDTGFVSYNAPTVILEKGYDFVIVNVDDDWPEGKIRPLEHVLTQEIEPWDED